MGHYAAAIAAKSAEPRAPLWTYVLAAQVLDIICTVFLAIGVEWVSVDPSLPGPKAVFENISWSHSLPLSLAWSVLAAVLAGWALKLPRRAVVAFGIVVFSHWILDFVTHRPDLALWIGGPKVGLGLWNTPELAQVIEMGLLGLAAATWTAQRARLEQSIWPALLFVTLLIVLQAAAQNAPQMNEASLATYASGIAMFLVLAAIAALVERRPRVAAVTV